MNKKLTLSIDERLISFAHGYSKDANSSLSGIIENFIFSLKKINTLEHNNFSHKTQQLIGVFKNSNLPSAKKMKEIFHEKHIN